MKDGRERRAYAFAMGLATVGFVASCRSRHPQEVSPVVARAVAISGDPAGSGSNKTGWDESAGLVDAAGAITSPGYCMERDHGIEVHRGAGAPASALLGRRFDVVPFQKRPNGDDYFLVAEHAHAFQFLIEGPEHPGPNMIETNATCDDGRKTIGASIGFDRGDGAAVRVATYELQGPPSDIYQTIAERLDGETLLFGFHFVRGKCGATVGGVPSCSAVVTRDADLPPFGALFWAAYLSQTHELVSFTVVAPSTKAGSEILRADSELLLDSFRVGP